MFLLVIDSMMSNIVELMLDLTTDANLEIDQQ